MAEQEEGAACARPQDGLSEDDKASDAADDNVTLSFLDKLKCMMYSKVERDAFLIEKLEKEEKKKAKKMAELTREKHKKEGKKPKDPNSSDKSEFPVAEEENQLLKSRGEEIEKQ